MHEQYADDFSASPVLPEGKTFRVTYDPTVGMMRLIARRGQDLEEVRKAFSVENKAAFFSQQYGYKGEPRLYNVNQFGYFQPGLVFQILEWLKDQYGTLAGVAVSKKCAAYVADVLSPLKAALAGREFEPSNVADDTGANELRRKKAAEAATDDERAKWYEFKMRPYQREALRRMLFDGWGRGMIEIPTAGGKSLIIANFVWNLLKNVDPKLRTLILVPNVQLVEQFMSDLEAYGFPRSDLAKLEGGMSKREKRENDPAKAKIVVANRQYLMKNEKAVPPPDVLVVDECHSALAESTAALVTRCPARLRLACSGTVPKDRYQRNQLVGMFGRLLYREEIADLQDGGYISKLRITSFQVFDRQVDADRDVLFHVNSNKKYVADDPEGCDIRFDDAVKAEHEYMAKWYRELYTPVLDYVAGLAGNTLVLFDKLDIGRSLYDLYRERHPEQAAFYNDGSTKVSEREGTRAGLEESSGNVLFANVQICGTGVSIKRLHNIVFCFSSKSTVRVIQSVGRVLRLYADKNEANLVDVSFNYKYSQRHYRERLQLYKENYRKSRPDEVVTAEI